MTRSDMISSLVELAVKTAQSQTQPYWLTEIFEKGFPGYGNFSDAQLQREMHMRGLFAPGDAPAEASDDGGDDLLAAGEDSEVIDDWMPDLLKQGEDGE